MTDNAEGGRAREILNVIGAATGSGRGRILIISAGGLLLLLFVVLTVTLLIDESEFQYTTAPVTRGELTITVTATGALEPVNQVGIGFNWNLFSAGAIRKNIDIANARVKQRLYQYESTVLGALEETESALAAYAGEENHRRSLGLAVGSAESVARLTEQKYAAGLSDFLEVLQAQQNLLSLQDQFAISEGESTARFIRIYRALGGGWAPERTK